MLITSNMLAQMAGKSESANLASVLQGLKFAGVLAGLNKPHRLAMFLAQIMHESGGFQWDREIWGPTAAQKRYDTRTDLGNTPQVDGDGKKYMGRTAMQITGKYNTTIFYNWCKNNITTHTVPDFIANPDLMNTDPWEGIGPIWYWVAGKSQNLNVFADTGNFVQVTKQINGGVNGLADRYRYYGRVALVLLGKSPTSLASYQRSKGLIADGNCGPLTLAALHADLFKLGNVEFTQFPTSGTSGATANPFSALWSLIKSILGVK